MAAWHDTAMTEETDFDDLARKAAKKFLHKELKIKK